MSRSLFELMDDMHLSAQSTFLDYYNAIYAGNMDLAQQILDNNPEIANQITNSENINRLINAVNKNEEQPSKDIDDKLEELDNDFSKLIDDTKEIGAYDNTMQYFAHNFVVYQGKHYFAKSTPPIGTLPTDTNYWEEYSIKGLKGFGGMSNINYRGNWDDTVQYNVYDSVVYQNKMWWAIGENKNHHPDLNHYPWQLIAIPNTPVRTPIQKSAPLYGYSTGDFWFEITEGTDVTLSSWELVGTQAYSTTASNSFVIDDIIYVVGGQLADLSITAINQAYDVSTNTWSLKASYPELYDGAMGFSLNGKGYRLCGINSMVGSILYSKSVYSYSPDTNSWTKKNDFPVATSNLTASTVCNGKAYVGSGLAENPSKNIYVYDETNDNWSLETEFPVYTISPAMQAIGDDIYVIGGEHEDGSISSTVYIYDTVTKTWSTGNNMIAAESYAGSLVNNDNIYIVGGIDSLLYSDDTFQEYNVTENSWRSQSPLQFGRNSLVCENVLGYGYAIGGINFSLPMIGGYVERFKLDTVR